MAVYKTVILAALLCLTQCKPQMKPSPEGHWRKIFSAERKTDVKDGNDKLVMTIIANLTVYGDFNQTTDHDVVANFVADKLSLFERRPEELREVYLGQNSLPLLFNMTVQELITLGSKPEKNIIVDLGVNVYAQKKKHQEAVSALKSLGSSF